MEKMTICRTCGAEYEASKVRCPYCGTGYAPAEEEEYMDGLEGIRKELDGHREDGTKSLKRGLGKIAVIVILIISAIVLLAIGGLWMSGNRERNRSERKKEEFLKDQGIVLQQEDTE